jgi:hypothetical protein
MLGSNQKWKLISHGSQSGSQICLWPWLSHKKNKVNRASQYISTVFKNLKINLIYNHEFLCPSLNIGLKFESMLGSYHEWKLITSNSQGKFWKICPPLSNKWKNLWYITMVFKNFKKWLSYMRTITIGMANKHHLTPYLSPKNTKNFF